MLNLLRNKTNITADTTEMKTRNSRATTIPATAPAPNDWELGMVVVVVVEGVVVVEVVEWVGLRVPKGVHMTFGPIGSHTRRSVHIATLSTIFCPSSQW